MNEKVAEYGILARFRDALCIFVRGVTAPIRHPVIYALTYADKLAMTARFSDPLAMGGMVIIGGSVGLIVGGATGIVTAASSIPEAVAQLFSKRPNGRSPIEGWFYRKLL